MSFFEDASLVLIPSGYKASKVYSVKPTDGTGDLTFTRSLATATRVGPDGLIEKVRTNLLLQSNGFNTASWVKTTLGTGLAPVVTANAGTAPDGTNTAFRVQFDAVGPLSSDRSILNQAVTSVIGVGYNYSLFVKAFSAGEIGKIVRFTAVNNTAGAVNITLTADYQRVSLTGNASTTSVDFQIETRGTLSVTAEVLLAFTQVEFGDIATPYIPTTTAAVSVGMLANVPRLDYYDSTCPRLLLEPQRTNLVTFSEQFNNADWLKSASATTITANTSISPSGFQDADTWTINSVGARFVHQTKTMTAGAVTASFFVKKGTSNFFFLRIVDGATNAGFTFNVANGTLGQSNSVTLVPTPHIEDYGNGWYRCSVTTTVVGTSIAIQGFVSTSATQISGLLNASLICWGAQLEQGSFATSYIPTLGATVTRSADVASKTGISALIGQTEGTLFAEVDVSKLLGAVPRVIFSIQTGTTFVRLLFSSVDSNTLRALVRESNIFKFDARTTISTTGIIKLALAYKSLDSSFYVNGVQITNVLTDLSFGSLTMSSVTLGDDGSIGQFNDSINQALLFKTRLSNAQLEELTA